MPVVVYPTVTTTTTVQNIIDGTSQDLRKVLDSSNTAQASILIDYCNRINLQLLRASNWQFLLSQPQQFITQLNVSDYWLGPVGQHPLGVYDTGLGLEDLRSIRLDSVFDRSNDTQIYSTNFKPLNQTLTFSDASSRPGRPKQFRSDQNNRYVLSIYPGPDNQNNFQPVPQAPICTAEITAGSLPARFYYVTVTYVDDFGNESSPSPETRVYIPANMVVTVGPPQEPVLSSTGISYQKYKVYASTTSGSETCQTASPLYTTGSWQEPNTGLISGATAPTQNNLEPIDGYLIEFQYYQTRTTLTQGTQVIQVPDEYRDVVIAGVNYLANEYLKRQQDASFWLGVYQSGVRDMVRDKWQFPKGADYIRIDSAAITTSPSSTYGSDPNSR